MRLALMFVFIFKRWWASRRSLKTFWPSCKSPGIFCQSKCGNPDCSNLQL